MSSESQFMHYKAYFLAQHMLHVPHATRSTAYQFLLWLTLFKASFTLQTKVVIFFFISLRFFLWNAFSRGWHRSWTFFFWNVSLNIFVGPLTNTLFFQSILPRNVCYYCGFSFFSDFWKTSFFSFGFHKMSKALLNVWRFGRVIKEGMDILTHFIYFTSPYITKGSGGHDDAKT